MNLSARQPPVALTVAGSDSGGGAGIQADLKTFAALGVFGTSALTAITAQNPEGVTAIQAVEPSVVAEQIRAVRRYFPVAACKTGMLFSREAIHAAADALAEADAEGSPPPLVVDPVMVATSGAKLLNDDAIGALRERILPRAALITPNMGEAEILAGCPVRGRDDLEPAARAIHERFGAPVLVKGGHLSGSDEALDILWDGAAIHSFAAPYLSGRNAHGTGCTLSAAITAHLARGFSLVAAVEAGKAYLHRTLENALPAGRSNALNHAFAPLPLGGGAPGSGER